MHGLALSDLEDKEVYRCLLSGKTVLVKIHNGNYYDSLNMVTEPRRFVKGLYYGDGFKVIDIEEGQLRKIFEDE